MNEARIEVNADGTIAVIGELSHQSVPALLKKSNSILFENKSGNNGALAIDLNAVTRSDSAGVALLIEWIRQARKSNKGIRFKNIPKQMHEIAVVSGVDKMLAM